MSEIMNKKINEMIVKFEQYQKVLRTDGAFARAVDASGGDSAWLQDAMSGLDTVIDALQELQMSVGSSDPSNYEESIEPELQESIDRLIKFINF